MCLELVMLVYGLYGVGALASGRLCLSRNNCLTGARARILGLICLAPFPLSILMTLVLTYTLLAVGVRAEFPKMVFASIFIEASVLAVVLWFLNFLGRPNDDGIARSNPRTLALALGAVLVCTVLDVIFSEYLPGPEATEIAVWGLFLGSLGALWVCWSLSVDLRKRASPVAEKG